MRLLQTYPHPQLACTWRAYHVTVYADALPLLPLIGGCAAAYCTLLRHLL